MVVNVEGVVFGAFHYFALAGSFVVDTAEMEYSVDYDAQEFAVVRDVERSGVGGDGVERDENVA